MNNYSLKFTNKNILAIIFIFALSFRLLAIIYVGNYINPPMAEFGIIARNIISGQGFSFLIHRGILLPSAAMPPGYIVFLSGVFWLFGDNTTAYILIQIIQALLGSLICVLIYKIAEVCLSTKVAFVSSLIASIYPSFIYSCTQISSFIFYCFINVFLFYLLIKFLKHKNNTILMGLGGTLGLLCLFRAEMLLYIPFLIGWIFFNLEKDRIKKTLLLIVSFFIVMMPWTVRNYVIFHKIIPTSTLLGYNLWRGHNPNATGGAECGEFPPQIIDKSNRLKPDNYFEINNDNLFLNAAIKFMKDNPGKDLLLGIKKFIIFWTYDQTYTPKIAQKSVGAAHILYLIPWFIVLVFFIIGLFVNNIDRRIMMLFYIYFILSSLLGMAFFILPRYRMVIEPFVIIIAAQGIIFFYERYINNFLGKYQEGL